MAVTIKDVAKAAQVSVASVSRAMNGHDNVNAATRQRILAVAKQLRYLPNSAARSLITRRSNTLGVLLPDLYGGFFSELIRGMDIAARARGLLLLLSSSHGNADEAAVALRSMRGKVDGLIVMSPYADAGFLTDNWPDALPIVLVNTPAHDGRCNTISIDNRRGAQAMVKHLVKLGHRRIAFIAGPEDNFEAEERRNGYCEAMARLLPTVRPQIVVGAFTDHSGYQAGHQLLRSKPRPQAIFAANDMMAIGCLSAIHEAGLKVPHDIALTGFDDIPLARYMSPPLSTIRMHISTFGARALDRLAEVIEHPDSTDNRKQVMPTELIIRASCGSVAVAATTREP